MATLAKGLQISQPIIGGIMVQVRRRVARASSKTEVPP
jgi:hypothetical protein